MEQLDAYNLPAAMSVFSSMSTLLQTLEQCPNSRFLFSYQPTVLYELFLQLEALLDTKRQSLPASDVEFGIRLPTAVSNFIALFASRAGLIVLATQIISHRVWVLRSDLRCLAST